MIHDYSATAAELIRFNGLLGIGKRLGGVQYGRILEYGRVFDQLELTGESAVLDLGSGVHSILPWFCAYQTGCAAHITDIGDYVLKQRRIAGYVPRLKQMLDDGSIAIETQDATALTYPDGSFDAVTAISSIEHIPDGGDSRAVREAHRVLKPGGIMAISVPVARGGEHQAIYGKKKIYVRDYTGEPVFFGYAYDDQTLHGQLVDAAPFTEKRVEYWTDHWWYRDNWRKRLPAGNFFKHLFGWWLTKKSLEVFEPVDQYAGSDAFFAIVVMRK